MSKISLLAKWSNLEMYPELCKGQSGLFLLPWAAITEMSCLPQYEVVQFSWLPERYYQTGDTALENAVLHEMENGKKENKIYTRDFYQAPAVSPLNRIV